MIYFAVDVDIQEGDIPGTVLEYFKGVSENVYFYNVGVYGTRNVANHVISNNYATGAFVSDMSSGYSGNLAYKMPEKWNFDQFVEYSIGGIDIDQVASSGKDLGTTSFSLDLMNLAESWGNSLVNDTLKIGNIDFKAKKEFDFVAPGAEIKAELSYAASMGKNEDALLILDITSGKLSPYGEQYLKAFNSIFKKSQIKAFEDISKAISPLKKKIGDGSLSFKFIISNGRPGVELIAKRKQNLKINGKPASLNPEVKVDYIISTGNVNLDKLPSDIEQFNSQVSKALDDIANDVISGAGQLTQATQETLSQIDDVMQKNSTAVASISAGLFFLATSYWWLGFFV